MQQSEVWINEGEEDERCFDVEYIIASDEDMYGRIFPVCEINEVKENGVPISDADLKKYQEEICEYLEEWAEEWAMED